MSGLLALPPGRTSGAFLLLALSFGARPARAERPAIEVVVSGTRTPESVQRATVRTEIVTREQADQRGATTVAEALAGETTLQGNPESYGYLGRPSGAQMQGLDAERILVLEDGERVLGDSGGVVDLAELPLTDVDRIEYVSGPTSSLYGTNALGGVINVVSGPPRAFGPSLRARVEARSRGDLREEASAAYRGERHWAVVDGSFNHRPGARLDTSAPDLWVPDWSSQLLGLRAGVSVGTRTKLTLRARFVRDHSQGLTSEQVPGLGRYLIDLPDVTDRFGIHLREVFELSRRTRLDFSLRRSAFVNQARRDRRGSPIDELRERDLLNQSFETVLSFSENAERTWLLGLRGEAERFEQTLVRTTFDLDKERIREVEPILLNRGAAFAQLSLRIAEVLTVMPGARAEASDRYGGVLAPRLALAFQPSDAFSLRAALGRGFRAPSAKEFGFLFDHSALGYRVLGNRELLPESSWGVNGDVTYRLGKARLHLGGFANWIRDLIGTNTAPTQQIPGVADYTYENVARARTAGLDASLRHALFDAINVDAGYAYLWTRDDSAEARLPSRPEHTLTVAVNAKLPLGLDANLRYRFVSRAFAGEADDGSTLENPSFATLDARVALSLFGVLELYGGALNLLDTARNPLDPLDTRPAFGTTYYAGLRSEAPKP